MTVANAPREAEPEPHDPRLDDALRAIAGGDLERGRSLAAAVAAERPTSARAAFLEGLALHKNKNYGAARVHFDRALSLGPTFTPFEPVYYFRGWCLYYAGDVEEARASFSEHLRRVPEEWDSHFGLGLIEMERGDLDRAEEHLNTALEGNLAQWRAGDEGRRSDVAKVRARLCDLFEQRGDDEAALAQLEESLRLQPAHYNAWYKLHQLYTRLGRDEEAAMALEQHDLWRGRVRPGSRPLEDAR